MFRRWVLLFFAVSLWCAVVQCEYDVQVSVSDVAAVLGNVPPLLFGVNARWLDCGDGLVVGCELVADRSLASGFNAPGSPWAVSKTGGAAAAVVTSGCSNLTGVPTPQCLSAQGGWTSLVLSAALVRAAAPGTNLTLQFAYQSSDPVLVTGGLFVFSPSTRNLGVLPTTPLVASASFQKFSASFVLNDSASSPALVLSFSASVGSLVLDEFRLFGSDGLSLDAAVTALLNGASSLRWPGGFAADLMDWKMTVGPLALRGEVKDEFNHRQTPSFGLGEFLGLCEQLSIAPYLQVNVLQPAQSTADLLEYLFGSSATTWGSLRTQHGHPMPYNVTYFELGNEPNLNYHSSGPLNHTGAEYEALALAHANVLKASGRALEIVAATEFTFQMADWLLPNSTNPTLQMLAQWNGQVFPAINSAATAGEGHWYPFFGLGSEEFIHRELMAGGELLRTALTTKIRTHGVGNFVVSEYGITVQNASQYILPEFLSSFEAGLVLADTLLGLVNVTGILGAHFWNFGEPVGYGMIVQNASSLEFYLRPSGIAFSGLTGLAGMSLIDRTVSGTAPEITASSAGTIPGGFAYSSVVVRVALTVDRRSGAVVLMNKNYNESCAVTVTLPVSQTGPVTSASQFLYATSASILASNDDSEQVRAKRTDVTVSDAGVFLLTLPARSFAVVSLQMSGPVSSSCAPSLLPSIF